LDNEIIDDLMGQLRHVIDPATPLYAISSHSGEGLQQLLFSLKEAVQMVRSQPKEEVESNELPVIKLDDTSDEWHVEKADGAFRVTGKKIERFAARTDFTNDQAIQRLRDIMRRQGILHELVRQGIQAGQAIQIGSGEDRRLEY
jgi:GTP-binding protein